MELICCCLASLCLQTTAGGERKTECLRDSRSLEGAPTSTTSSLGHPFCTVQCSWRACLYCSPSIFQSSCFLSAYANPSLKQSQDAWVPLPPSGLSGIVEATTASHSALIYVRATALTSAACTTASAGSNDDLQQLLCLTALGRSCHNRSYNA